MLFKDHKNDPYAMWLIEDIDHGADYERDIKHHYHKKHRD